MGRPANTSAGRASRCIGGCGVYKTHEERNGMENWKVKGRWKAEGGNMVVTVRHEQEEGLLIRCGFPSRNGGGWEVVMKEEEEGSKDESTGALNYERTIIDRKLGFHTGKDAGIRVWGKMY